MYFNVFLYQFAATVDLLCNVTQKMKKKTPSEMKLVIDIRRGEQIFHKT